MAIGKHFLMMVFVTLSFSCFSQINRYMVFFKDKTGSLFSVMKPIEFLSEKAIDRRIRDGVDITEMDFPVNKNYVEGVKSTGAEVFFTTRWMNGLLVQCPVSVVPAIESLAYVDHVEFVAPGTKLVKNGRRHLNLKMRKDASGSETENQLGMIGIPEMQEDGYRGEGVTIAVFDGGFLGANLTAPFEHVFSENLYGSVSCDFVSNTNNVFQYDDHGTEVFSVITGYIADVFTGGAYNANYQLYVTEDVSSEYRIEEYNWLFAAERADSAGADIISSSLGYYDFDLASMNYTKQQMDGKTAVVTKAAQWAADRGILVVCSAGNEGNIPSWRIITAPADAVDVIAVANVNLQGERSFTSSIGPSADGRIKPDLAALGSGVRVVRGNGSIASASGTSLSTPLITSLAAGLWQRYPDLSNRQLMEALKNSASKSTHPDTLLGYGIPHYAAVVHYLDSLEKLQPDDLFAVYPNPVIDSLTVQPVDPDSVSSCRIELVSSAGRRLVDQMVEFTWLNDRYKMDISTLPAGLYYMRVWFGKQYFVFKVIKQ